MQDGAGCHQSKKVTVWLKKKLTRKNCASPSVNWRDEDDLDRWPSNSPDLNPIENLWSIFQNAVAKHQPKTTDQFRRLLTNVWWYEISQDYIRDLFDSMPRRVHAVIQREGKMSKY